MLIGLTLETLVLKAIANKFPRTCVQEKELIVFH